MAQADTCSWGLDIASISAVEGKNWRHGDIEDMLKTIACIKGHKWTSTMVKRVYFGLGCFTTTRDPNANDRQQLAKGL